MNDARREELLARYRGHAARFDDVASRRGDNGTVTQAAPPTIKQPGPPTGRELEVLQLIADGLTNDEIAQRLFVSLETVKTHVRSTLSKLQASSRAHAVALGLRAGLVS